MDTSYAQTIETPAALIRRSAICYVIAQAVISFGLLYALTFGDMRLAYILAWATAFWGPLAAVIAYKRTRTAWRLLPPDDLNDISFPSLYFALAAFALWIALH